MMFIWLASVVFSYFDSEFERDFDVTVMHAFKSRESAEAWTLNLPLRKIDACHQANWGGFEGVPKVADDYQFIHTIIQCVPWDE